MQNLHCSHKQQSSQNGFHYIIFSKQKSPFVHCECDMHRPVFNINSLQESFTLGSELACSTKSYQYRLLVPGTGLFSPNLGLSFGISCSLQWFLAKRDYVTFGKSVCLSVVSFNALSVRRSIAYSSQTLSAIYLRLFSLNDFTTCLSLVERFHRRIIISASDYKCAMSVELSVQLWAI